MDGNLEVLNTGVGVIEFRDRIGVTLVPFEITTFPLILADLRVLSEML